jgi:hypothetical protein
MTMHTIAPGIVKSVVTMSTVGALYVGVMYAIRSEPQDYLRLQRMAFGPPVDHVLPRNRLSIGEKVVLPAMTSVSGPQFPSRHGRPWLLTAFSTSCVVSFQSAPFWNRVSDSLAADGTPYLLLGCANALGDVRNFQHFGDVRGTVYFAPCSDVEPLLKLHGGIVHYLVGADDAVLDEWEGMPIWPVYENDLIAQVLRGAHRPTR